MNNQRYVGIEAKLRRIAPLRGNGFVFIVAVLITFLSIIASHRGHAQQNPVPVQVSEVREERVVEGVSFVATLEPNLSTRAGAVVSGRVVESDLREGDKVVAGKTILMRLDRTSREIARREAKASAEKAQQKWQQIKEGFRPEEIAQRKAEADEQMAVVKRAEKDYLRARSLFGEKVLSQSELERQKSEFSAAREKHNRLLAALELVQRGYRKEEIAQAEAEFREAKARLDLLEYDLDRTSLRSPISGFVVKKHVEVGTWVNAGDPVMDLVDLDPVYAAGPVGEKRIDLLKQGLPATVMLDALPGQSFQGTVSHIVPQADPQSRTFPVKIKIPNPQARLKSGMLARVTVKVSSEKPSLLVPKDAVIRSGIDAMIFSVSGDIARSHKVTTGRTANGSVEIFHPSLKAGDRVVVLGNELLKDGAKVRVETARSPNASK